MSPGDTTPEHSPGAMMIMRERERQMHVKWFTSDGDDQHTHGELAEAASAYLKKAASTSTEPDESGAWPFDPNTWNPESPFRNLVKAGALIAAEIDRRIRAGDELPDHEKSIIFDPESNWFEPVTRDIAEQREPGATSAPTIELEVGGQRWCVHPRLGIGWTAQSFDPVE